MSLPKRYLSRALLTLSSVLLALAAAEAYLRLFDRDLVDPSLLRARLDDMSIGPVVQPSTNEKIFFELKPNLSTRFKGAQITTGPEGFRIDPEAAPQPAGAKPLRVAVIGDSVAFGWGVDYPQSYPELFRSRMQAHLNSPVELRNYSVPGYNSEQELAAFLEQAVPYRPSLLIVHHDPNDPEPIGVGFFLPPDYMTPEYGDNVFGSFLIKLVFRQLRTRQNKRTLAYDTNQVTTLNGYIVDGALYHQHMEALKTIASQAAALHMTAVAVLFEARVSADPDYATTERYLKLHHRLKEQLEAMGYRVLDLFAFYQERMAQLGWKDMTPAQLSRNDLHPNPVGHQLIADALTSFVLNDPALMEAVEKSSRESGAASESAVGNTASAQQSALMMKK